MVYLGKSKIDKTKRISLIKEIADLLDAEEGDYIEFYATKGKIMIAKQTKSYNGFNFESEEIERRIYQFEKEVERKEQERLIEELHSDPSYIKNQEEQRALNEELNRAYEEGYEEYMKDINQRKKKK